MHSLHRLEGFYRVARAGGYALAVADFPYAITQPAIHQQVRKLESELGQKLFRRVAKGRMALTAAGEHLFAFCAPFFERLPAIALEVSAGAFDGTLRIDAGSQELRFVMPQWLQRMRETQPHVRVELQEVFEVSAARLRQGKADVLVEHWPEPPPDIEQQVIATARAYWAVPRRLARGGRVNLAGLKGIPFIGFNEASPDHALQLRALKAFGLNPPRLLFSSSTDTILVFVEAGLGFTLVPWPESRPKPKSIAWQRLNEPDADFAISASWLRQNDDPLIRAALAVSDDGRTPPRTKAG